jgi:hypothetical protein
VFDGGAGASAARNQQLRIALAGRGSSSTRTWVGADLALETDDPASYPPVPIELVPDAHRHLGVIGAGARSAVGVLQWAAVGLGASDRATRFVLVDALRPDDGVPAGAVAATAEVLRAFGCEVEVSRERAAATFVERFANEVERHDRRSVAVVFGCDRLIGLSDPLDPEDTSGYGPTVGSRLEQQLERAGVGSTHLLAWWSTFDAFEQVLPMRHALVGIRTYLGVPAQRIVIATGGQVDEACDWPLALLHDAALGGSPRELQVFEPFGEDTTPGFLTGGPAA